MISYIYITKLYSVSLCIAPSHGLYICKLSDWLPLAIQWYKANYLYCSTSCNLKNWDVFIATFHFNTNTNHFTPIITGYRVSVSRIPVPTAVTPSIPHSTTRKHPHFTAHCVLCNLYYRLHKGMRMFSESLTISKPLHPKNNLCR